jgi:two-component system, OmpR family, phosphate regulon sensor histidine kinase PhoR
MNRKSLIWQIFPPYLLVILLAITAVTWVIVHSMKDFYLRQTAMELEARAILVRPEFNDPAKIVDALYVDSICKTLGKASATRLTIILPSGLVTGDSDEDPSKMENHAHRPEIQEALAGRTGVATRYSHTLFETMMYVAVPIKVGDNLIGVSRAAIPITALDKAFRTIYARIILGAFITALLAAFISLFISRRISRPLIRMKEAAASFTRGDFAHRLPVDGADEVKRLALAMNEMAAQLDDKVRTIVGQRNELEAVLSSMVEGVLACDSTERIINLNEAAAQLLGLNRDQTIGRYLQEAVRNAPLLRFISSILKSESTQEEQITIQHNGTHVFHVYGTLLKGEAGQFLGALVVLHDITRLSQLETVRRDFVANVSHELRTPITSIKGFVETLRDGAIHDPDDAERFLGIIARQTDRLNSIIEDLLMLSEIEQADRGTIGMELTPLIDVLNNAVATCEPKARAKEIGVKLTCDEKISIPLNAPLFEQAIINLIDNAIKYSDTKSAVEITAQKQADQMVVTVSDQGCGIEKMHLSRLFERFYRVDRARSRELGGTGLGLSIVRHIVLAHGGDVGVESTPGKGSRFFIRIPASRLITNNPVDS